ncbi:acetate/propionate family kinase [Amycolatopsis taiwanensis]|uniref:Acetate kinase n=1 Tax=Amycolatopsis taiwanensis TaxID=342230 RepID=A0A9W6R631_9PSEU|nr:acetate kinase [Amycolatopsis taiwanensis]GLY69933.1 acetate kinase [Amycolatopsis taiwanensis]
MRILTLSPGASSLKAAVVVHGDTTVTQTWAHADIAAFAERVHAISATPDAVAVRFAHGGSRPRPVVLDESELANLERLTALAPTQQPVSVQAVRLMWSLLPGVPVIACFDTSFHNGLPEAAARYALPRTWTRQNRLRRYGFHGLSCRYALRRTARMLGRDSDSLRLVCCHLGSAVSVTAIRDGHSVDTSMGFTPVEGAVSSTRSGSVDPGLLLHVLSTGEIGVDELSETLFLRSGLAGMTGTSGDVREVLAARAAGDSEADIAIGVYLHRLRREIGAAAMSLDRLDAVVFTGGVAEHQPALLSELLGGLAPLGLQISSSRVAELGDRLISVDGAAVAVLMITARIELELARAAEGTIAGMDYSS